MKTPVLIRFMHGLGDAVQFTVVLKHIARHRPNWEVDMLSLRGKHSAFHGLCRRSYHDQEPGPGGHAQRFDLGWYENYNRYLDRPNSKITNCLHEVFAIPYEPDLGRYQLQVSAGALERAGRWLESIECVRSGEWSAESGAQSAAETRAPRSALCAPRFNAVIFHYQGNTSQEKKNLRHDQVAPLLDLCLEAGYVPVILDWDRRSPLFDNERVFNPGVHAGDLWGGFGSGDAEMIAALIQRATAFIGIDSGPGKCASATDTPALICWTGLHPVQFHDPAPNTTHLVPANHRAVPPAQKQAVAAYFEKHYQFLTYSTNDWGLPDAAADWLRSVLHVKSPQPSGDGVQSCRVISRYGFWIPAENPLQSWTIIEDIYLRDSYKTHLRPRREGMEYVVDVGANIGAFAKLWHKRNPEAKIACIEVNPKLLAALEANTARFATIIPRACHYGTGLRLLDSVCPTGLSMGGSRVVSVEEWLAENDAQYIKPEEEVPTITLEEIQTQLGFPRIDILKLDCEGSEFSILDNADLSRIGTVFVESHGSKRWRELLDRRFRGWDIGHMSRSACGEFENWHLVNPVSPG